MVMSGSLVDGSEKKEAETVFACVFIYLFVFVFVFAFKFALVSTFENADVRLAHWLMDRKRRRLRM